MNPQVSDGWLPIIAELQEKLNTLPLRVVQIKEKFGQLRVYVDWQEKPTLDQSEAFLKAVEIAQYRCSNTCEVCGEPGKLIHNGWYSTRCKEHENYTWN